MYDVRAREACNRESGSTPAVSRVSLDIGCGGWSPVQGLGAQARGTHRSDSSSGVGLAVEDRHRNSQVHGHPSSPIGQKRDALGSSVAVDK